MKLIVAAIFALLAISAHADVEPEWVEIDWSKVVPVTDMPGFWDGREIRPAVYPGDMTRTGRIVGGTVVAPNSIPFQAGLLMSSARGTGLCGGSLITNRIVLTAAHCPIGTTSTQVILGAHNINTNEATQQRRTVQASGYRLHAQYNPSNLNNDIATLVLATVVNITPQVQLSVLPAIGTTATYAGILATVSGWGRIADGQGTSATLRSVQNNIITNAVCAQTFGSTIIASTLCISTAGGRGSCNGDSGGPLTVPSGGARLQVGVVSFGASAGCERGFPAGFARVTSFRQWIANNSN